MSKSSTHNKKRNSGLLYEFLVRTISRALVDGDKKKSSGALKLLRRHFRPGTELYKEFRLINALVRTSVSTETTAGSIINEAKQAARGYDTARLDREKSLLIKHINHALNDDSFYDQQVNEYKMYATVQTLVNDWRSKSADLARMATYEDQLMQHLITKKEPTDDRLMNEETNGTARLLVKVMTKKLNEKYDSSLNEGQKSLLRAYVFSTANDDPSIIGKKLLETQGELTCQIDEHVRQNADSTYLNDKLLAARKQLIAEDMTRIDDETVTRFMLYTKLIHELTGEE